GLIGCLVMWICWKRSRAFNRVRLLSDGRARMERCLAKMGISDDTRVSEPVIKASGDMVRAIHLGDNDRADQIKTDDIAHMLKTDPARVIVTPVKGSTRKLHITHLAKTPDKGAAKVHPALKAEHRKAGAAWAPGVRSIREGLPIGTALGAAVDGDPVSA